MPLPTATLTPPNINTDFSKIFSQNSPLTPFSWSESDYLTGWNVVGSTPPARTQFDALQRMTDEKLKALKDSLDYFEQFNQYLKSCVEYLEQNKVGANSPAFTGDPKAPTPAQNDNDTSIATTAFVRTWVNALQLQINSAVSGIDLSAYARLASPSFSGSPTAPTPATDDNSQKIATTAFVRALINSMGGGSGSGSSSANAVTHTGGMQITTGRYYIKFGDKAMLQFSEAHVDSDGMARCFFPVNFWTDSEGTGHYVPVAVAWQNTGYAFSVSVGGNNVHRKANYIDVYVVRAGSAQVATGEKVAVLAFGTSPS